MSTETISIFLIFQYEMNKWTGEPTTVLGLLLHHPNPSWSPLECGTIWWWLSASAYTMMGPIQGLQWTELQESIKDAREFLARWHQVCWPSLGRSLSKLDSSSISPLGFVWLSSLVHPSPGVLFRSPGSEDKSFILSAPCAPFMGLGGGWE